MVHWTLLVSLALGAPTVMHQRLQKRGFVYHVRKAIFVWEARFLVILILCHFLTLLCALLVIIVRSVAHFHLLVKGVHLIHSGDKSTPRCVFHAPLVVSAIFLVNEHAPTAPVRLVLSQRDQWSACVLELIEDSKYEKHFRYLKL